MPVPVKQHKNRRLFSLKMCIDFPKYYSLRNILSSYSCICIYICYIFFTMFVTLLAAYVSLNEAFLTDMIFQRLFLYLF